MTTVSTVQSRETLSQHLEPLSDDQVRSSRARCESFGD